jgi:WD40 repeat protein
MILDLSYSPTGEAVAVALGNRMRYGRGTTVLLETKTWCRLHVLKDEEESPAVAIAFTPSGGELLSASDGARVGGDGRRRGTVVTRWDAVTGQRLSRRPFPGVQMVDSLGFTSGGDFLAIYTRKRQGYRVDSKRMSLAEMPPIPRRSDEAWLIPSPTNMATSPDGDCAVVIARDASECVGVDLVKMLVRNRYDAGGQHLVSVTLSPDARLVAGCTDEGGVHVWDRATAKLVGRWQASRPAVRLTCTRFLHRRSDLLVGSSDGAVQRWSAKGKLLGEARRALPAIDGMAISPDDEKAMVAHNSLSAPSVLLGLNLATWEEIIRLEPARGGGGA